MDSGNREKKETKVRVNVDGGKSAIHLARSISLISRRERGREESNISR